MGRWFNLVFLPVVESDLLPFDDVPDCEHTETGQVRIQTVDPNVEDGQVGITTEMKTMLKFTLLNLKFV